MLSDVVNGILSATDSALNKVYETSEQWIKSLKEDANGLWLAIVVALTLIVRLLRSFLGGEETEGKSAGDEDTAVEPSSELIQSIMQAPYQVTSGYGVDRRTHKHQGVDVVLKDRPSLGHPLHAPFDGTVVKAGRSGAGGNVVYIQSGDKLVRLMHLDKIYVSEGQQVSKGFVVGTLGNTGRSTGPHVHIELLIKSADRWVNVNPSGTDGVAVSKYTPLGKAWIGVRSANFESDVLYSACYIATQLLRGYDGDKTMVCAAIIGNLIAESNMDPRAYLPSRRNKGAQGLAQWRGSRLEDYKRMWGKYPVEDPDVEHQIEFVVHELKGNYNSCLRSMMAEGNSNKIHSTKLEELTRIFHDYYEKSGDSSAGTNRTPYSEEAFKIINSYVENFYSNEGGSTKQASSSLQIYNRGGYNKACP